MLYRAFDYIGEIWRPITDDIVPNVREGRYFVSNFGFITNSDYAKHRKVFSFNYLGQFDNRPYVNLTDKNGHQLLCLVSRIVAKAFCPGYAPGLEVNHIDGEPMNNYYNDFDMNLEWVTRQENIRHAYDNNLIESLIDEKMAHNICRLLEEDKLSAMEIAETTGLSKISANPIALISAIKKKKLWCHVSKYYKIPEGRHNRIFNDDQIHNICKIIETNGLDYPIENILNDIGCVIDKDNYRKYANTISAIKYKRRYTYISCKYNF